MFVECLSTKTSYYGPPAHECQHCGAQFWYQERVKRSHPGDAAAIRFHLCCRGGKVSLPLQKDPPSFLDGLLSPDRGVLSKHFIKSIRTYNSMFAFTSLGAKIDTGVNKGLVHMCLRSMARSTIELDPCCPMRVQPRRMRSSIFLTLMLTVLKYQI